ncbi:hypothetical protein DL96DRAFT_1669804 [Flagelloscypha sp. PMI_526]|nr:hypothetical protein DL96DRAFT_1669804 [Flagelloscypha sp. PMI_526]
MSESEEKQQPTYPPQLNLKSGSASSLSSSSSSSKSSETLSSRFNVPAWIKDNCTISRLKPVIRCAIATWISVVLFVIPKVQVLLGQASFLLLIAMALSPPAEPFLAVLEREVLILLFVNLSWAWTCLGIFLANLVRKEHVPDANLYEAISTAKYIELAPSLILGAWALGSGFFLYVKARQGPGPYIFATVFGCILIDISVTTASLVPYPYYAIGKAVVLPLAVHSAIALLCSILIFPASISALFTNRLEDVMNPLVSVLHKHTEILKTKPSGTEFRELAEALNGDLSKADAAMTPLASSARLLPADLIYCRFAPTDFTKLHELVRKLIVRANGMQLYFTLIDPTRPKFPVTPAPSHPATPTVATPAVTRPPSVINEEPNSPAETVHQDVEPTPQNNAGTSAESSPVIESPISAYYPLTPSRSSGNVRHHSNPHHHHHHHHLLHLSLSHKVEPVAGLFESQRYLNLENRKLYEPDAEENTDRSTALLQESCDALLTQNEKALTSIAAWLPNVRRRRFTFISSRKKRRDEERKEALNELTELRDQFDVTLKEFQGTKRLVILEMYKASLEGGLHEQVPHRHLFNCFVYQYHLLRFSTNLLEMLNEIIRLETERQTCRLWTPVTRLFKWSQWQIDESIFDDDENPDVVKGIDPSTQDDFMPMTGRRDPDALPPRNVLEWGLSKGYQLVRGLAHGNALFAMKAAILTLIMCLPSLIKSSAVFAYNNRFFWGIVMAQLTLARFRGDTVFGVIARIVSTLLGGIVGMAMWYVGNGTSSGNPYGFAAVFAVCLPFLFFARIYYPGPPMTTIIFIVTSLLVTGYSYQQKLVVLPGAPGVGWHLAWRSISNNSCSLDDSIFSLLPPNTTLRSYHRNTLATVTSETGNIYCCVVSFANCHKEVDTNKVVLSLSALRSKMLRILDMKENAIYEYSLRGRWPVKRYHEVLTLLKQSRLAFLIPDFQGDVLAVFMMLSTALRTWIPSPSNHSMPSNTTGLHITAKDSEEDYGLPRELNMLTLSNEQYLCGYFCVGVSTTFSLMRRLDRLMYSVKQLVGENYHIEGVGVVGHSIVASEAGSRPNLSLRTSRAV